MYFCFYVPSFRCPPQSSNFGDERVKSMNKCPIVLSRCPPSSSNLGDERVKSMHDLSVLLFCHQMTVSHANSVNATCGTCSKNKVIMYKYFFKKIM